MRLLAILATSVAALAFTAAPNAVTPPCAADNAGLKLAAGFCATLFAESLPGPRHMVVAPNGDLIVALRGVRTSDRTTPGGVAILRDADGDGRAESRNKFGEFSATEVRLVGTALYTENGGAVLRYALPADASAPTGAPDTIVSGLPSDRSHTAKTFLIHGDNLFVNQGSATNVCQDQPIPERKSQEPCPELESRAGIWRYSATKTGQTLASGERFATGVRNAVAMAINPANNDLYVMQHGRDVLATNWPKLFTNEKSAETPAEEMFRVSRGDDFGWPHCYYDPELQKKVLAPEYGGDGKTVGLCATKKGNVGSFPGHWAPNGLHFYTGNALPAKYKNGAFIVFHGSWNRAPLPLQGFKVVFQPMLQGRAAGPFEVFVDGFYSVENNKYTELGGRPMGLTQGRNGELYLSDDSRGRIWRISYVGPATP
ncbi:MAG: sorbosone dehydrogenase [Gemmatimonadota bacterium]